MRIFTFLLTLFTSTSLLAQIVTIDPQFATQDDNITVTFDASQGNGELEGIVPVYAHTGVILEGQSGWQNVQGEWGTADDNVLMTPIGNNQHQLSYNISDFYGLEEGDVVEQLAFVFRNANGSVQTSPDIFVDLFTNEFAAAITSPVGMQIFEEGPSDLEFSASSNQLSEMILYMNNDQLTSDLGVTELSTTLDFSGFDNGEYWLWVSAFNGSEEIYDSTLVIIQGDPNVSPAPAGTIDGINYIDDETVVLQIYAPFKEFIYVLGDFNNWQFSEDYFMNKTPEGDRFWLEIGGLNPGQEYRFQYSIDDQDLRVADVYAEKILDPWNDQWIPESVYPNLIEYPEGLTTEIVSVLQTAQEEYDWQVESFERPPYDNLVIYELLIRDFDEQHSYQSVIDRLDYLEDLGVNAIQFMPFTEFEGNESWGYNPMFYFAPDKYYGTEEDLKQLIDECHMRGIAVIQDVVLNHSFGQNPQHRMYSTGGPGDPPAENSPFFNPVPMHPFNVGYDYNHDAPIVQEFTERNLRYWVQEYKIDGFRFDLSKGFTQNFSSNVAQWNQYDQSRVDHWNRIKNEIYAYDDEVYIILEHLGDNPEETVLANNGMMLWGNINHEYNEASMGYNSNLSWADYQNRGWENPRLVSYAESHDEERLMYKNLQFGNSSGSYDVTDLNTALSRQEAIMAFNVLLRGPKMHWQFGELGYDYSINYCIDDGTVDESCRTGNKPIRWDYLDEPNRERLYKVTSAINKLKTEQEAFRSDNYTWDVGGTGKRLIIEHESMDVVVIANFDVDEISMVPGFTQTGIWYDYFAGESIEENNLENPFLLQPGEYRIYTTVELETPDITVNTEEIEAGNTHSLSVFPNPTKHFTQVAYRLNKAEDIRVEIRDIRGNVIKTLYNGIQTTGNHMLRWDLRSDSGARVSRGVYIVSVLTEVGISNKKLIVN